MQNVHVVGVLGCGLMGSGIAQVAAQSGYRTGTTYDEDLTACDLVIEAIIENLDAKRAARWA